MKFAKASWEKSSSDIPLSQTLLSRMVAPLFPNKKIESFDLLSPGLANTNIRFKVSNLDEYFVLRIYARNQNALTQELLLSKLLKNLVPLPEFLYAGKNLSDQVYAIQRWIKGKPMYMLFNKISLSEVQIVAQEVAKALANIASHTFPKGGFFKDSLDIVAFESPENQHPFVTYIKHCLFEQYSGKWLGEEFAERIWKFILEHQSSFPSQEPACLVHGDFNLDNILIDENTFKVAGILDWEFAFSGSYLFDIGTLFRFEVPKPFEEYFIETYQVEANMTFPDTWHKMIKLQDLSNLIGLLNTPHECPNRIHDIKILIEEILTIFPILH